MKLHLAATLALIAAAGPAAAQDADWSFRTTLYLWVPGLSTEVETPFGSAGTDLSPSDALSDLDMGFMGTFAAQNGPWVLFGDLIYSDLSDTNATPNGLVWDEVTTDVTLTAVTGYALYDVNPTDEVQVALGAGARYFDVSLETDLTGGLAGGYQREAGDSWIVPVLAAQFFAPINDQWYVTGAADWGMSGNDNETWQIYGGLGYRIDEQWSTQIGYRYMELSKDMDNGNVDLDMSGLLIGVTYEF